MAELTNKGTNTSNSNSKEFATDEKGMMVDAKTYARRDASTTLKTFQKLGFNVVTIDNPIDDDKQNVTEELIMKTLLAVKYEQIENARTKRPSYEQYFD